MLVRFSSVATESITMFGDVASLLIKMLGASDAMPGAIGAADIAGALSHLRKQLQIHEAANPPSPGTEEDDEDESMDREPSVALAVRAAPLIEILERAAAAKEPVMWEKI